MITDHVFPNGLTVKELKKIILEWSDVSEYTGEDCTVWVTTGDMLSSPVIGITPLNRREHDNKIYSDILFETDAFK